MKKKLFFNLLFISIIPAAATVIFFYLFQYMPVNQKTFDASLRERIQTLLVFSKPQIEKAVDRKDDVGLLLVIESIMKISDISSVYVLDNAGKVLAHNKVAEWGKVYEDNLSQKAIEATREGYISAAGAMAYISKIGSTTLVLKINQARKNEAGQLALKTGAYSSAAVMALTILFFIILFQTSISRRFKTLSDTLKSIGLGKDGRINSYDDDEFGHISKQIDEVIDRFAQTTKEITIASSRHEMKALLGPVLENTKCGIIVIDSENRIIAINKRAVEYLGIDPVKDYFEAHIVDVFGDSAMMDIIRSAIARKISVYETKFNLLPVRIELPNNESGNLSGIVILIG
jgi:sensor histidine kinase regulating citrate/malate metabolism